LEPLDRGAHKNGLIGPTREAVELALRIRAVHPAFAISWDSSHAALCGENLPDSLTVAKNCIAQIHLANAVLDRQDPRFGDHHIPIGPPGFLNPQSIADLFAHAAAIGLFGERRPGVSVEVRSAPDADPWKTEKHGRRVIEEAWAIFTSRGAA
jgi:sugar phosphate isomerase/epimerase